MALVSLPGHHQENHRHQQSCPMKHRWQGTGPVPSSKVLQALRRKDAGRCRAEDHCQDGFKHKCKQGQMRGFANCFLAIHCQGRNTVSRPASFHIPESAAAAASASACACEIFIHRYGELKWCRQRPTPFRAIRRKQHNAHRRTAERGVRGSLQESDNLRLLAEVGQYQRCKSAIGCSQHQHPWQCHYQVTIGDGDLASVSG